MSYGVHGQVQGNNAVAADGILQRISVFSAFCEITVAMPAETATYRGGGVAVGGMIDGEVQGIHAWTIVFIGIWICVHT